MTDDYRDDELNIEEGTDDISFEETDAEGVATSSLDKIKKLRTEVAAAKKESLDNLTGWQKERAEFINFKKGEAERIAAGRDRAVDSVLFDVLAVADSFDMAMGNAEAWSRVDANWRMGVEYIYQQLQKVLSENNITEIPVKIGDQFNHDLHEPVESIATGDAALDHTITKVLQKGYQKGDKVLRPAKVNVYSLQ